MWRVGSSPMCCHVSPASVDLYTPLPGYEYRTTNDSPVPAQTTRSSEGATATAPIDHCHVASKMEWNVVPPLSVFHRPPLRVPT